MQVGCDLYSLKIPQTIDISCDFSSTKSVPTLCYGETTHSMHMCHLSSSVHGRMSGHTAGPGMSVCALVCAGVTVLWVQVGRAVLPPYVQHSARTAALRYPPTYIPLDTDTYTHI
jgi:hypothetical protein